MKSDFLFAGLNLNRIIQNKSAKKGTFYRSSFKNTGHYMLKLGCCLPPPLSKFLATRLTVTHS